MREEVVGNCRLICGDCLDVLKEYPDNSIDVCVTDPPYGLSKEPNIAEVMQHWISGDKYEHRSAGFMGKSWDSFVPGPEYWREVYRVLKPGAHCLVFAGTRTWDLMSVALRFAGFENRDTIASYGGPPAVSWVQGQGFPKSLDVSKAIDREAGIKRKVVGEHTKAGDITSGRLHAGSNEAGIVTTLKHTVPTTDAAKQWSGWGTSLKPCWEVILVFRKPLEGRTVAQNVLKYGTGGINIDGCRIGIQEKLPKFTPSRSGLGKKGIYGSSTREQGANSPTRYDSKGRFPANVILSYPEDEYILRDDVTPDQLHKLAEWINENTEC